MIKKKIENTLPVKEIDYIKLVDELSDEAYKFCVSYLYPIYNYRVLKEEEIRRVDLKENLLRVDSYVPKEFRDRGLMNYYLYVMKLYLNNIFICEGKRAERYKDRSIDAIDKALGENGSIDDVDDAFLGFLTLLNTQEGKIESEKKFLIRDPLFKVRVDDAEILKALFENTKSTPERIDGKKGIIDKRLTPEYEKLNARKFMYINNILFLARAIQNFGGFEEDEE